MYLFIYFLPTEKGSAVGTPVNTVLQGGGQVKGQEMCRAQQLVSAHSSRRTFLFHTQKNQHFSQTVKFHSKNLNWPLKTGNSRALPVYQRPPTSTGFIFSL